MIVCPGEIQNMAARSQQSGYLQSDQSLNVVGAHQSQIRKCGHPTLAIVFLCYTSHLLWHKKRDKFQHEKPAPINTMRLFSIYQRQPSCGLQFSASSVLLRSAGPVFKTEVVTVSSPPPSISTWTVSNVGSRRSRADMSVHRPTAHSFRSTCSWVMSTHATSYSSVHELQQQVSQ